MPSGGRRPGAGRPKGAKTKKVRCVKERDVTPLDVMLEAMEHYRGKGDFDKAASFAKDAAPYCHAKLASVQVTGADGGPIVQEIHNVGPAEATIR